MKISIVCGLNESRDPMDKVMERFEELCRFLKNLKYDGIELSLLDPEGVNPKKINEILESYNFELSALGTGSSYIRYGYSLGHYNEHFRQKAIEKLENYIKFANHTNSKVIIGLIRGRYTHESSPKKEKLNIISSLKKCVDIAKDYGVILCFEPINRFEIDSYNTISKSIDLLKKINSENLKLLIDSFHIYLEEDPGIIWEYLDEISQWVSHIHIADSTRRAPGSGHFDFKSFLNIFKNNGYKDYISIETIMKPSFEEVAKSSVEYLHFIL